MSTYVVPMSSMGANTVAVVRQASDPELSALRVLIGWMPSNRQTPYTVERAATNRTIDLRTLWSDLAMAEPE